MLCVRLCSQFDLCWLVVDGMVYDNNNLNYVIDRVDIFILTQSIIVASNIHLI